MTDTPHEVDIHIGQRIKERRNRQGVSQVRLGEMLGVSFQQIQKYEKGRNRVSASMMWKIARALGVSPAYFFEGIPDAIEETVPPEDLLVRRFAESTPGHAMLLAASALPRPVLLGHIALMQAQFFETV